MTIWADLKRKMAKELQEVAGPKSGFPSWLFDHRGQFKLPVVIGGRFVGNSQSVLFMKLIFYALKFGADRLQWVDGQFVHDASFFGILRVLIPTKDRVEFSEMYGEFPLLCEVKGGSVQKKTLHRNYALAGLKEFVCENIVVLGFDETVRGAIKAQFRNAEEKRKEKRADAVVDRVVSVDRAAVTSLVNATDSILPPVSIFIELQDACKLAIEAEEHAKNARKRVQETQAELVVALQKKQKAEERVQELKKAVDK